MLQQLANTSRLRLLNKPRLVSARLLPVDVPLTPTSLESFSFLWLYKGQTRRQRATSSYKAAWRKKHRTTTQRSLHLFFFFQILFWDVFLEKQASRVIFFKRCCLVSVSWWSFCVSVLVDATCASALGEEITSLFLQKVHIRSHVTGLSARSVHLLSLNMFKEHAVCKISPLHVSRLQSCFLTPLTLSL